MVLLWSLFISGYFCDGTGLVSQTGLCEAGFYCSGGAISPKPPRVSCACTVNSVKCICGTKDHKGTLVLLPLIELSLNSITLCIGCIGASGFLVAKEAVGLLSAFTSKR